jgi:hypothetical protein
MHIFKYGAIAGALMVCGLPSAQAQLEVDGDMLASCSQIDSLRKAGNFAEARNKAQQCLQGLEQELGGEISTHFRAEVGGWTRTSLEQNAVLGFTNVSATYEKGGDTANVSLTGGGGGGGGLGGVLGGFARLGLQAGKQVRVGGLPGAVQPDGTITVTLEDGSFLIFSSSDYDTADAALAGMGDLVNAFPVADINEMLQ